MVMSLYKYYIGFSAQQLLTLRGSQCAYSLEAFCLFKRQVKSILAALCVQRSDTHEITRSHFRFSRDLWRRDRYWRWPLEQLLF